MMFITKLLAKSNIQFRSMAQMLLLAFVVQFMVISCKGQQAPKGVGADKNTAVYSFTLPAIPAMLTTSSDRAAYLVAHYWDNFDFKDTTLITKPEITEQALCDFLDVLSHVPVDKSGKALTQLMTSASADSTMFAHFIELMDKYLYDPNSPMRNEEFYVSVLKYIISSPKVDELNKMRPQYRLDMAMKNRTGDKATDFAYSLSNGKIGRINSVKADCVILFFNNPDCHDCKRIKELLENNVTHEAFPLVKIVAIYPDEDVDLWHKSEYPSHWINGHDKEQRLTGDKLYDLKAIPCLYLLDKDKRVVLKDAPVEAIIEYLQKNNR